MEFIYILSRMLDFSIDTRWTHNKKKKIFVQEYSRMKSCLICYQYHKFVRNTKPKIKLQLHRKTNSIHLSIERRARCADRQTTSSWRPPTSMHSLAVASAYDDDTAVGPYHPCSTMGINNKKCAIIKLRMNNGKLNGKWHKSTMRNS